MCLACLHCDLSPNFPVCSRSRETLDARRCDPNSHEFGYEANFVQCVQANHVPQVGLRRPSRLIQSLVLHRRILRFEVTTIAHFYAQCDGLRVP